MIGVFDSGDAAGAVDADIGWITGIRTKFRGNQFSGDYVQYTVKSPGFLWRYKVARYDRQRHRNRGIVLRRAMKSGPQTLVLRCNRRYGSASMA